MLRPPYSQQATWFLTTEMFECRLWMNILAYTPSLVANTHWTSAPSSQETYLPDRIPFGPLSNSYFAWIWFELHVIVLNVTTMNLGTWYTSKLTLSEANRSWDGQHLFIGGNRIHKIADPFSCNHGLLKNVTSVSIAKSIFTSFEPLQSARILFQKRQQFPQIGELKQWIRPTRW